MTVAVGAGAGADPVAEAEVVGGPGSRLVSGAADGPDADGVVRGEHAELLSEQQVPVTYGEGIPDDSGQPVQVDEEEAKRIEQSIRKL